MSSTASRKSISKYKNSRPIDGISSIRCSLCCSEVFPNQESFRNHLIETVQNVSCPICYQKYDDFESFKDHLDSQCKYLSEKTYDGEFSGDESEEEISKITLQKEFLAIVSVKLPDTHTEVITENTTERDTKGLRALSQKSKSRKRQSDHVIKRTEPESKVGKKSVPSTTHHNSENPNTAVEEIKDEQLSDDEYLCTACNLSFTSIEDHVKQFHEDDEIEIETMPSSYPVRKRRCYSQETLKQALGAVRSGTPRRAAAKKFGIPRGTINEKISGRYADQCSLGRPSILSPLEERSIVDWANTVGKAKFPILKDHILCSVARLFKDLNNQNAFSSYPPGEKWFQLFLKRNPEMSKIVSQSLVKLKTKVTEDQIRNWFSEVNEYLVEKDLCEIFKDPSRVFNSDETAFFLNPKAAKVLIAKGDKTVYKNYENAKKCVTVLMTVNAAGQSAPPMVLYNYEKMPTSFVNDFPENWGLEKSGTGWMTGDTFYEYVTNILYPWMEKNVQFPVVLFIDGLMPYLTMHLSNFCLNHKIELIALYPNSNQIIQPMDIAVFNPIKTVWAKSVNNWKLAKGIKIIKNKDFAPLLKTVLDQVLEPATIIDAFKTTGIADMDFAKLNFIDLQRRRKPYDKNQTKT